MGRRRGSVRTVVVPTLPADSGTGEPTAAPLVGNGFDPARIYASRSEGVVTIYSYFANGQRAQGSGFVVSEAGHLTNSHVVTNSGVEGSAVKGADRLYVVFHDGDRIPGSIVGWDLFNDTGLVKVDPNDHAVSPVPLGDSSSVVVGEPVAAIGSPFGQEARSRSASSPRRNARSSRSRPPTTSRTRSRSTRRSTTATRAGRCSTRAGVIGINAQIRSDSGNAEGVGFAIPINSARRSMEQLISTGKVAYAYVGVTTQDVTPALARRYGLGATRR